MNVNFKYFIFSIFVWFKKREARGISKEFSDKSNNSLARGLLGRQHNVSWGNKLDNFNLLDAKKY